MSKTLTDKQVIAKLKRKGGKTVNEIGTSATHLRRLERQGAVQRTGVRRVARRGRPAIEYGVVES